MRFVRLLRANRGCLHPGVERDPGDTGKTTYQDHLYLQWTALIRDAAQAPAKAVKVQFPGDAVSGIQAEHPDTTLPD